MKANTSRSIIWLLLVLSLAALDSTRSVDVSIFDGDQLSYDISLLASAEGATLPDQESATKLDSEKEFFSNGKYSIVSSLREVSLDEYPENSCNNASYGQLLEIKRSLILYAICDSNNLVTFEVKDQKLTNAKIYAAVNQQEFKSMTSSQVKG